MIINKDISQNNLAILHCHTEHSLKESPMKIKEYVKTAKEMGYQKLAITDFGSMTGIFEFIKECKDNDIDPIIGLEAYVGKNEENKFGTIVLLARNYEGYQDLCKALYEGYKHIYKDSSDINKPIIPYEALEKCTLKGNVYGILPALNGIMTKIVLSNKEIEQNIAELKENLLKLPNPEESGYRLNKEKLSQLEIEISSNEKKEAELEKIASKTYEKPLTAVESIKDRDIEEYNRRKEQLDKEIEESKTAKTELRQIKAALKEIRKLHTIIAKKIKSMEDSYKEYYSLNNKIEDEQRKIRTDEEIDAELVKCWNYLGRIFGEDNIYIEITNHGDKQENEVLKRIIDGLKLPEVYLVAENEPYFAKKDDYHNRQIMVSMQNNEWVDFEDYEKEYYIKSQNEIHELIKTEYSDMIADSAVCNIKKISDNCNFILPKEHHYPKYIENGAVVENSAELLRQKAYEGINREEYPKEYADRLEYELDVIIRMGFADYLLIVQDFIQYGKKLAKENNEYGFGYGIGPGRGSAAGSLVCYRLGITDVDPIKYNLKFERFLNEQRVTMPDIDIDFSSEIRYKCAEYVAHKYGEQSVAFIRTKLTQKAKAAIRNVARILSSRDFGDPKKLQSVSDKMAKVIPLKDTKAKLKNYKNEILATATEKDQKYVNEIYDTAEKVEGLMIGLSVHAAGVIIGDGNPLYSYVPMLYNDEMNVWAVQCDKVESEESAGLLKMDFLGLKNLDVITECGRRIKKHTGIELDINNLPYEDDVFRNIFSEGKTGSVFQFESLGMREMLKNFKPSSFEDIILLVAAYRPGPMDSIPKIIESKHGKSEPYYCVPELKDILAPTYGYPIYQEQLMDIFSICAGFSQGEADIVRRNMSKKKVDKFLASKPQFINGLIAHGASEKDAEDLWEQLVSFSEYAFNKSHATAYAKISYITAYLKYHYPEYYMCSILNNADIKKYEGLLYECREMGINVLLPDINRSGMNFENVPEGILYGLGKMKSVKSQVTSAIIERKENGAFLSFKDFIKRTKCTKKLATSLINAGCFDCFRENMRSSYTYSYDIITKYLDDINSKESSLLNEQKKAEQKNLKPYRKQKIKENIEKYTSEVEHLKAQYASFAPPVDMDEYNNKLDLEYGMLCAYISAHPLDAYKELYNSSKIRLISDFDTDEATYIGMIKNLRITQRKSDGSNMGFFEIEDISGTIQVCCFVKEYAKYENLIKESSIIEIYAKGIEDEDNNEELINKLVVKSISKVKILKDPIFFSIKSRSEEIELYNICKQFEDENGHPVIVHHQDTGEIFRRNMSVNKAVLDTIKGRFYGRVLFEYKKLDYTSRTPY